MKKITLITLLLALTTSGCNFEIQAQPVNVIPTKNVVATKAPDVVLPTQTNIPVPIPPTEAFTPTPDLTPTLEMFPVVTFVQKTNCRKGPAIRYYSITTYLEGHTSQANGRNADSSWIWVQTPDNTDYCWVPISSMGSFGNVGTLHIVDVPQTLPDPPWRLTATGPICGSTNNLVLEWSPVLAGTGYHIYRNGKLVGEKYAGFYIDYDTPRAKKPYSYFYDVEAFNAYGVSERASITVDICE